jgi:hypothetical protein
LALNKSASASSASSPNIAKKANDGIDNKDSRWTAKTTNLTDAYLDIDFGEVVSFNQIRIHETEFATNPYFRITEFKLQVPDEAGEWNDIYSGSGIGAELVADFETVASSKVRLLVVSVQGTNGASINEFEVYKK